jgi:hypothetical protein
MKRFSRPDTHAEIDTDIQVIVTLADFARILKKVL